MIITDDKKIDELLTRGVEEIIDKNQLRAKLKEGRQLRIKFGVDPTSPNIHIGRSVPLLKLRDFQQLGHKIILIIGDFTGVIGDTSDKESERPMLRAEQVKKNMKNYIQQAQKILNLDECETHHNSEWLNKLRYQELCEQANIFSLNDFNSRDNIRRRLDAGKRVSLRELLYPLMQGYDSVVVKADVEIGGTDQRFNLLAGRELQRHYGQKPQDIMTNPLIEGLDGRKMSSSWGNVINLFDSPDEMYGKTMSLKDEYLIKYFTLTTRLKLTEIEKYQQALTEGLNPRDLKMKLAYEIVRFYHSEEAARDAQAFFINTFSKKEVPDDLKIIKPNQLDIISVLVEAKFSTSKTEARRVIEAGGVKVNSIVIDDYKLILKSGDIVQKGKRFFVKIK